MVLENRNPGRKGLLSFQIITVLKKMAHSEESNLVRGKGKGGGGIGDG